MKEPQKEKSVKKIIEKYRFIELENMEKPQLITKFHELYKECKRLAIERDIAIEMSEINSIKKESKPEEEKPVKYSMYNPEWGGIEKVVYILKENGYAMTSKEIERELLLLEPSLKFIWDRIQNAVGRYTYRAMKCLMVVKYKQGNKYVYGLPEWG